MSNTLKVNVCRSDAIGVFLFVTYASGKIFDDTIFFDANTDVTAADVAEALGMEKRSVDGVFTSAIQRKELGARVEAEIELEDGTHKPVKFLSLTPAGMSFDPDADAE